MRISVLGLGYIGLPTAIIFALNGHRVKGFDISEEVVNKLNGGQIHIVEDGLQPLLERVLQNGSFNAYSDLQESDAYIISVPTPFKTEEGRKTADLSYVEEAARLVGEKLKEGDLVILESTVPPMTTRKMTDILARTSGLPRQSFYTAHCPERVLPGNVIFEMEHNDRIIGSEREEAALKAKELYETFLTEGKVLLTDDVTAEMCKLVENSYRDVNIAFANELSIICSKLGIKVEELISMANRHPRVNVLTPGVGVGGHCLAVDPYFITGAFPQDARLIASAREINDFKPHYISNQIEKLVDYDRKKTIAVLGMSYKPDIDDFRESPSMILAKDLQDKGYTVIGCEPNTRQKTLNEIPIASLEEVLDKADFIIVAQKHREFLEREDELNAAHAIYASAI